MSKMGSHDPFGYLNHKLWSKDRSRIKLPIWPPTIKSKEFPLIIYAQMACHISLERFWQELQIFFKPHLNRRFEQKVMGLQISRSPNFKNFETLDLGVLGQNDIWVQAPWLDIENIIKGKVVASLKCRKLNLGFVTKALVRV